ncbi:hypothetical protein ACD578_29865 (plasmid) [Microvirga sp. RSM25]|uniref:hypothetical protein n=1 Tax=Microvirga sp. RSM25 TaxID=3273802 RepID=UPI00384F32C2
MDFDSAHDTFFFDAVGLGGDADGANFINHSSGKTSHLAVDTFYSGAASGANGEHVTVITDRSFASASDAASAISDEHAGDIIVYLASSTGTANLAYVTSENHMDEFARLANVNSLAELRGLHLTAWDFMFV